MRLIAAFCSLVFSVAAQAQVFTVHPRLPQFLRPGDRMELSLTVTNHSGQERTGQAELQLSDFATNTPVDGWFHNFFPNQYFTAAAKDSTSVVFPTEVPFNFFKTARLRFFARAGTDTATASVTIPVLYNSEMFTHTAARRGSGPLTLPGLQQFNEEDARRHAQLLVQTAASASSFAYNALPSLLGTNETDICAIVNELFAASLLQQLANKSPETATEMLRNAASFNQTQEIFTTDKLQEQLANAAALLLQLQHKNGSFPPWRKGAPDAFTSAYFILTVGRLQQLAALPAQFAKPLQQAADKALRFLKTAKASISTMELAYLESLLGKSDKKGPGITASLGSQPVAMQALAASTFRRRGETAIAQQVIKALQNNSKTKADEAQSLFLKIPSDALLLEASILTGDKKESDSVTMQLLQQKTPQGWSNAINTNAAAFAILLTNDQLPGKAAPATLRLGNLPPRTTNGNAYVHTTTIEAGLVHPALGNIVLELENETPQITLVHWQYFDETVLPETGVTINRNWKRLQGNSSELLIDGSMINKGDTIEVSLEIDAANALSGLKLSDGLPAACNLIQSGTSTNKKAVEAPQSSSVKTWLIDHLPAGKAIFTYRMKAVHSGTFSSGTALLQDVVTEKTWARIESIRINVE